MQSPLPTSWRGLPGRPSFASSRSFLCGCLCLPTVTGSRRFLHRCRQDRGGDRCHGRGVDRHALLPWGAFSWVIRAEVAGHATDTLPSADQRASLRGGSAPAGRGQTPLGQPHFAAQALVLQASGASAGLGVGSAGNRHEVAHGGSSGVFAAVSPGGCARLSSRPFLHVHFWAEGRDCLACQARHATAFAATGTGSQWLELPFPSRDDGSHPRRSQRNEGHGRLPQAASDGNPGPPQALS